MKERLKRLERLVQVAGIDATSKTILLIREEFYKLEERLKIAEESKADADSDYAGECDRLTAKNVALQTRLQKLEKAMRLISQEKCQTGLSDCGCVMCIARAALQGDPSV